MGNKLKRKKPQNFYTPKNIKKGVWFYREHRFVDVYVNFGTSETTVNFRIWNRRAGGNHGK